MLQVSADFGRMAREEESQLGKSPTNCLAVLGGCGQGLLAGVTSVRRHQGLSHARHSRNCLHNGPAIGSSRDHQQSWWHLCENVFKKEHNAAQ